MTATKQSVMKLDQQHIERIHRVVRYIEQAIDKEMPLEELAKIACFSPFHFQRVFSEVIGETPKQFIKRLRLEEAARIIAFHPEESILSVALQVGFQSLEAFSRAFKNHYAVSPDTYRKSSENERISITQASYRQIPSLDQPLREQPSSSSAIQDVEHLKVEIVRRSARQCVYLKTTLESPQLIDATFARIRKWSHVRELVSDNAIPFGIIKDYPIFTALDRCRFFACMDVEGPATTSGLVGYLELPEARYAAFTLKGGLQEIITASRFLVHTWLPENGYRIKLDPVILNPLKDPFSTPFNENVFCIYLPIQPEEQCG
jgi:AraC family transcriptional regulator